MKVDADLSSQRALTLTEGNLAKNTRSGEIQDELDRHKAQYDAHKNRFVRVMSLKGGKAGK